MTNFLLWCILLVLCWPLALALLVIVPIVWLILLPFQLIGMVVGGLLSFIWGLFTLPFRIITCRW